MGFIEWLKSFPMDENGTPAGDIWPGLLAFIGMIIWIIVFVIIGGSVIARLITGVCY